MTDIEESLKAAQQEGARVLGTEDGDPRNGLERRRTRSGRRSDRPVPAEARLARNVDRRGWSRPMAWLRTVGCHLPCALRHGAVTRAGAAADGAMSGSLRTEAWSARYLKDQ